MIGHWAGSGAEVTLKIYVCSSLPSPYKDFCDGSTVFIHELLIEPAANLLFYMWVNKAIGHTLSQEDENSSNNKWFSLFAGAVTSIHLSKAADWVPDSLKPQFITDHSAWVEAVLSLPGGHIGGTVYETIAQTDEQLAKGIFSVLLAHKVYTNLYQLEEGLDNEGGNTCLYKHPLVDFCRPEEQWLIIDHDS